MTGGVLPLLSHVGLTVRAATSNGPAIAAALKAFIADLRALAADQGQGLLLIIDEVGKFLPRSSARQWIVHILPPRERPTASAYSLFLDRLPNDGL